VAVFLQCLFDQRQERLSKRKKGFVRRNVSREVAEKHDMEEIEMAGPMDLDQHNIWGIILHGIPVPYEAHLLLRRLGLTLLSCRCILLVTPSGSRWSCMSKAPSGHGLQCGYLSKPLVYLEMLQAYISPVDSSKERAGHAMVVVAIHSPKQQTSFTPQAHPADPASQHRPSAANHKTLPPLAILFEPIKLMASIPL